MDAATRLARQIGTTALPAHPGLLSGTRLCTQDGLLPVDHLQPGDRIVTRGGARRLLAVSVQRRRQAALVRIKAGTLGHHRPEADLLLSPGQPVLIRDWRARALYGAAVAAVPAARLLDGEFVVPEFLPEARIFVLRFAEDEVIYTEGLELLCPSLETAPSAVLTGVSL